MASLAHHDLQFALLLTPKQLLEIMKRPEWAGKIFVGGGFLRSIVAGDPVNDIDVFVTDAKVAEDLADELATEKERLDRRHFTEVGVRTSLWRTDNAITVKCYEPKIQIIHRWTFKTGVEAADSFDFTCCAAMFWWGTKTIPHDEIGWQSYCDPRFYCDVAGKRLIYRNPVRNEDAGGSMLRVLKYYQKGYRIPLDSLADVITRLCTGVRQFNHALYDAQPGEISGVICGLLREVNPAIDPSHVAHLPAESSRRDAELGDTLAEHL